MRTSELIADGIHDGHSQIGVQRAVPGRLKFSKVLQRTEDRILNQVLRIRQVTCPSW